MATAQKHEHKARVEQQHDKGLKDTFPASDPPATMRSSAKKGADSMKAARIDRKPPILSGSSEAVTHKDDPRAKR